eukprot:549267-Pelagomonas_calceolata.AAC.3
MLHSQLALAHGRGIQDVVDEVQQARATGFDGGDGFEHLRVRPTPKAHEDGQHHKEGCRPGSSSS